MLTLKTFLNIVKMSTLSKQSVDSDNPYQNTSDILYIIRKNNPKICMKPQKNQSDPEAELKGKLERSQCLILKRTRKL